MASRRRPRRETSVKVNHERTSAESVGEFFSAGTRDEGLTVDEVASGRTIRTDFVKTLEEISPVARSGVCPRLCCSIPTRAIAGVG